ncbi:MAG: 30S ribosomal protein S8 [Verrucomicrobiales bacterium]
MATLTDPIADFLIRWKNASRAGKDEFTAPFSRIKADIAKILQEEGFIWKYEVDTEAKFPELRVTVKYSDAGHVPVLTDLKRVSKPGIRKFVGSGEIPKVRGGLGIAIVSTSKGVMAGHTAKKQNVGGEVLALVW